MNVMAYSGAGAITSASVGGLAGFLGDVVLPRGAGTFMVEVAVAVGFAGALRELGLAPIPLPQMKRQTADTWAKRFKGPLVAALWGADIGLAVTTRMTFAGGWFLLLFVFGTSDPVFGAIVMLAYWIGRASSVWIAAALLKSADATLDLMRQVSAEYRAAQLLHALFLAASTVVVVLLL